MAALLLGLAACSDGLPESQGLTGEVVVDGSSTVTPLVAAGVAEFTTDVEPGVTVDLTTSGTGEGLARLCAGGADVAMASREMTDEEAVACRDGGVEPLELAVGADAVTLVVPRRNDYVDCLTTAELAAVWSGADGLTTWADVRPEWPATTLALFAPGAASGTADVFTDELLDGAEIRPDAARSEDDEVIVQGVAASPGGFGVVPLGYAVAAEDSLRTIAVDSGAGCIDPTVDTVTDGSYAPLSRPVFVYVAADAYRERQAVMAFVDHLLARVDALAAQVDGVPPAPDALRAARETLARVGGDGGEAGAGAAQRTGAPLGPPPVR